MIPVTLLTSPYRYPAVTFPVTTILLDTTRPVVAFVNSIVCGVTFPVSVTELRGYDGTILIPPRVNDSAAMFPSTTKTLDPSSSTYRFEPTLNS